MAQCDALHARHERRYAREARWSCASPLPPPSRRLAEHTYEKWRSDLRCVSSGSASEEVLGLQSSLDSCRKACVKHAMNSGGFCNFFLYGTDGDCRWQRDTACIRGQFEELSNHSIYKAQGAFTKLVYQASRTGTDCNESMLEERGGDYRGCQSGTRTGLVCQRWDSQYPHVHDRTQENFPEGGLVENFCRNPDRANTIWCYTMSPDYRWEWCDPINVFLTQAGMDIRDPQPHEVFAALEIAVETDKRSELWVGLADAVLKEKLAACLAKLPYQEYQHAPLETQLALVAATTMWLGSLSRLNLTSARWDPQLLTRIEQVELVSDVSRFLNAFSVGTEVPGSLPKNWEILVTIGDPERHQSEWQRVLRWAKHIVAGDEIRRTLAEIAAKLPVGVIEKPEQYWDEFAVSRRWADANDHYNISGACDGSMLQEERDYQNIFGKTPAERRKVMQLQIANKSLLLAAVSNCKCLCTCTGHDPLTMCSRVIRDLVLHYKEEDVALDTMAGDTADTAAMLAARAGSVEVARMLRNAMLEQSYARTCLNAKIEQETGTHMFLFQIANVCNTTALLALLLVYGFATLCFRLLHRDFRWSNPFEHNTGTLLRLLVLISINLGIEYACVVFPLLWQDEDNTMSKLVLIMETPWNISPDVINLVTIALFVIGAVGFFLDLEPSQRRLAYVNTIEPTDIYQDPGVSVANCMVGMTATCAFFLMYWSYFSTPVVMTLTGSFYWLLATAVQAKLSIPEHGSRAGGNTFTQWMRASTRSARNPELWATMLAGKTLWSPERGRTISVPSVLEVYMRRLFSYTSNVVFRSIIIFTLPLFLAASSQALVDFVLNACALTFIWEYDDLQDPRTYEVVDQDSSVEQLGSSSDPSCSDSGSEMLSSDVRDVKLLDLPM